MGKHRGRPLSVEDAKLLIGCIDGLCALDEGRRTQLQLGKSNLLLFVMVGCIQKLNTKKPTLIGVLKNQIYSVL